MDTRTKKHLALAVVVFSLALSKTASASIIDLAGHDGGQAGSFLDFAASARSLAMGKAHTGVADDASAVYWNAAGLTQLQSGDAVMMYSTLYEGFNYGTLNVAQPTERFGTIGMGIVNLRSDGYRRFSESGAEQGSFSESRTALLISDARKMNDKLSLGATLKAIHQDVGGFSGSGAGLDLGMMYKTGAKSQLGFTIRNAIAPRLTLQSSQERYPADVRLGLKVTPKPNWLVSVDASKTEGRNVKLFLGGEFLISKVLSVRGGLNEAEFATGLGLDLGNWALDYSLGYHQAVSPVGDIGLSHRFGVRFRFGNLAKSASRPAVDARGWKPLSSFIRSK